MDLSSNWLSLEDAFQRLRARFGSELAVQKLEALLCNKPSAKRHTSPSGEVTSGLGDTWFWENEARLSVVIDADGFDHITVRHTDYVDVSSLSGGNGHTEFFVRISDIEDIEREEGPAPTTAPPPTPPSEEANRTLRRRSTKHPWNAICGEIARRCIDPKTRRVNVPKNESKLAEDVLLVCQNTLGCDPPVSDLREAVSAICSALRKI